MSIVDGIQLGLSLSRGSRDEVRRDEMLAQQQEQIRRNQAYQDQLQPRQLEALDQDIASSKANQEHLAKVRPLEIEAAQARIDQANDERKWQAEMQPLQKDAERARANAYKTSAEHDKTRFEQEQEDRRTRLTTEYVTSQAPIEWENFEKGGQFSDEFLRKSAEIRSPLSPMNFLDGEYVNALHHITNVLDPSQPESAADKGQLMTSLNTVFGKELNIPGTAANGSPITKREITDIHPVMKDGKPVRGKFYVNLRVTPETGEPYDAPLTMNRSADPKDPVREIDLGDVVKKVRSQSFFSQAVNGSPVAQSRLKDQVAKMKNRGKSDEIQWAGGVRKFDDILEIYKNDKTLQAADGTPLVSFADFQWTAGDPDKLNFVVQVAEKNNQIQQQVTKALEDGDADEAAKLQAGRLSATRLWELGKQAKERAAEDAAKATASMTAATATNEKDLRSYQASNPKWYLEPDLSTQARKAMTKEQWAERAAEIQKQNEVAKSENEASQKETGLRDIQAIQQRGLREFGAQHGADFLTHVFPSLKREQQMSWLQSNQEFLSKDQQAQAQAIIQRGTL